MPRPAGWCDRSGSGMSLREKACERRTRAAWSEGYLILGESIRLAGTRRFQVGARGSGLEEVRRLGAKSQPESRFRARVSSLPAVLAALNLKSVPGPGVAGLRALQPAAR